MADVVTAYLGILKSSGASGFNFDFISQEQVYAPDQTAALVAFVTALKTAAASASPVVNMTIAITIPAIY